MHRIDQADPTVVASRRPEWRQRLVQAERGFVIGLRSDSTLFGHLFGWLVVAITGMLLRLHWQQWIVVGLCLSFALTAELFHQAIRTLVSADGRKPTSAELRAVGLATAGVVLATVAAVLGIVTIFWQRVQHILP